MRSAPRLVEATELDDGCMTVVTFDSWKVFLQRVTATRTTLRDWATGATRLRCSRGEPVRPRNDLRQRRSWLSALQGAVVVSITRVRPPTAGVDRRGRAPGVEAVVRSHRVREHVPDVATGSSRFVVPMPAAGSTLSR